jgi:hypothetical protein
MQVLGKNMTWMLKMKEQVKGIEPKPEEKVFTNFIR